MADGTIIFTTKRCVVREITLDDLPALYDLYAGPGMTDYLEPLYDWDEELEYQRNYIEKIYGFYGYGMWVVIEKKTGRLIGRVGFDDRTLPDGAGKSRRILEFGFMIAADLHRQGFAEETCRAAISFMEEHFEERVFTCLIEIQNEPARHLAKKLGFSHKKDVVVNRHQMQEWTLDCDNAQKEE